VLAARPLMTGCLFRFQVQRFLPPVSRVIDVRERERERERAHHGVALGEPTFLPVDLPRKSSDRLFSVWGLRSP